MNPQKIFLPVLALVISLSISLALFTGCSKSGDADDNAGTLHVEPAKAEILKQFIEKIGGIENARRALMALAEIERDAA